MILQGGEDVEKFFQCIYDFQNTENSAVSGEPSAGVQC